MKLLDGILDRVPSRTLADHLEAGGGRGLAAARGAEPSAVIDEVADAGLRGRGGGGFPTGTKWRTVAEERAGADAPRVVVNAAEGEPGTFKDRTLLRTNPYKVLEGALIAAHAVGADRVVVAMKGSFRREIEAVARAIEELDGVGLSGEVSIGIALGPKEYLFGEETALLEVLERRQPFPRVAPPYRGGLVDEAADVLPPTLVNNVETLANVPSIVEHGADRFRRLGTDDSPGTVVCTVSGSTRHDGVAELELGTTLADAFDAIGGGAADGRRLVAALSGVANPIIPAEHFDTPMTYEDLARIGSGLGAAGFTVYDDRVDVVAVAHGVARFLAVESCGQCEPCKSDGLAIADRLGALQSGGGTDADVEAVRALTGTVADGARCFLATQQQQVIDSVLQRFPDDVRHRAGNTTPAIPVPVAPITDIRSGQVVLDDDQFTKQPDWSSDSTWSGAWPAQKLADTPVEPPTGAATPMSGGGTAGASIDASDATDDHAAPFASLVELHDEVIGALDDLPHHPCPQRGGAIDRLGATVRAYHDVTGDVLYPIAQERLRRDSSEPTHEAVQLSEEDRRAADRLLRELESDAADRFDDDLDRLDGILRRQIALDREVVVPGLGVGLPDRDLVELGHALDDASAAARHRHPLAAG